MLTLSSLKDGDGSTPPPTVMTARLDGPEKACPRRRNLSVVPGAVRRESMPARGRGGRDLGLGASRDHIFARVGVALADGDNLPFPASAPP